MISLVDLVYCGDKCSSVAATLRHLCHLFKSGNTQHTLYRSKYFRDYVV